MASASIPSAVAAGGDGGVRKVRYVVALSGPLILMAGAAFGHAFGQRYDLPIPLSLYLFGAGTIVALSFVIAALSMRLYVPALEPHEHLVTLPGLIVWQAASITIFLLVIAAGLLGVRFSGRRLGRAESTGCNAFMGRKIGWADRAGPFAQSAVAAMARRLARRRRVLGFRLVRVVMGGKWPSA